ncbi:MAG: dihydrolipoamide acetyltransferase family protein, partial [Bdellovibrionia bacterium]
MKQQPLQHYLGASMQIKLPEIGEGVTEGELVRWLVKVGDTVKVDQAIAEVMTDKATVEVPSPQNGKVTALVAKEGANVPIGGVLLELEAGGASAGAAKAEAPKPAATAHSAVAANVKDASAPSAAPRAAPHGQRPGAASAAEVARSQSSLQASDSARFAGATAGAVYPPAAGSRVLATPSTRRLAREMSIDINNLKGSGLAGRVTREDVTGGGGAHAGGGMDYVPRQAPVMGYTGVGGTAEERVPIRGIRKKVAEKMQLSKQIIPHFTLMDEANVDELVKLRSSVKEKMAAQGVKVTYLPFVMKTLIATAREFMQFNASIDDASQEIVYKK